MSQQGDVKPFRVIICGGGMVGLALAHALQLANIDHVVLEKHSKIVSLHGAALTILPGVARIFDQFGFLHKIQPTLSPITKEYERWPDGSVNCQGTTLADCGKTFDLPVLLFDRERCVAALYDNLPDQSKVRTNARVERIVHTDRGVQVILTDGSIEEGDIVIGADGVHSVVRELMWEYAAENEPDAIPQSDKQVMFTQYKAIFGVSDGAELLSSLGPADVHVVYGYDDTNLLFTQPGFAYWAMMWKDEYSQPPKTYKPNSQEQAEVVNRLKDRKFTESITFGDLWESRSRGGLVNIEEGVLDKWHAGRMVLVGDSAHKMSADLGIGANMGIESAVVLCNILHRETKDNRNRHFTTSELSTIFDEYQSKRHERVSIFKKMSGDVLRMRSFETTWKKIFISRIATIPAFQRFQAGKMFLGLAQAPKLDYAPTRTINENAEGWDLANGSKDTLRGPWLSYALMTSLVGIALSYAVALKWGFSLQSR